MTDEQATFSTDIDDAPIPIPIPSDPVADVLHLALAVFEAAQSTPAFAAVKSIIKNRICDSPPTYRGIDYSYTHLSSKVLYLSILHQLGQSSQNIKRVKDTVYKKGSLIEVNVDGIDRPRMMPIRSLPRKSFRR